MTPEYSDWDEYLASRSRGERTPPPDPTLPKEPVEWVDPGPDPFNLNWEWENEPDEPSAAPPLTTPAEPAEPAGPVSRSRIRPYIPWAVAAAALLIAVASVWWANRRGEGVGQPSGEFVATTELTRHPVLGADHVYSLAVRAPEDGFVTVVLLPPDGPPLSVYPDFGGDDIPVQKGRVASVNNLPDRSKTRVVAFVTATPASETVRKAVDKLRPIDNLTPEVARRAVLDALRAARQPWVAVSEVTTIP